MELLRLRGSRETTTPERLHCCIKQSIIVFVGSPISCCLREAEKCVRKQGPLQSLNMFVRLISFLRAYIYSSTPTRALLRPSSRQTNTVVLWSSLSNDGCK